MLYEVITALLAEAAKRILITDGAFGTEIQQRGLTEADYAGNLELPKDQKGNNDILALTVITSYSIHYTKLYDKVEQQSCLSRP